MRIDKLTNKFQEALGDAQSLALGADHAYIEPAHLLLAMLNQPDGPKPLLERAGVRTTALQAAAQELQRGVRTLPRLPKTNADDSAPNPLWGRLALLLFGLTVLAFLTAIDRPEWFHLKPASGTAAIVDLPLICRKGRGERPTRSNTSRILLPSMPNAWVTPSISRDRTMASPVVNFIF